ncbi:hypothetical protein T439DRAFT_359289 [Meredithblackwellia eburnea MCA 4105]
MRSSILTAFVLGCVTVSALASWGEDETRVALGRRRLDSQPHRWETRASKAAKAKAECKDAKKAQASTKKSAASNSTATLDNSNSTSTSSSVSSATSPARTRARDQGDQSLAAGLQAMVTIGIGQQAAVLTIQNLTTSGGAASDISDAITRLQQFQDTAKLQLQMAQGIADDGSFAQPQLALLATAAASQDTMIKSLTGDASDAKTLSTLLNSFASSTNDSQDGVSNALVDCFLPLTAVSG